MLKLKNISGAFLFLLLVGTTHVFGQNPSTNDTLRYVDKIPHWLSVYQLTAPDYLQAQRKQFKSSAYVETYVEAVLDHPAWMFNMLNQFTALRNTAARNTPHIVFNVRYKPLNNELTNYEVLLAVRGSAGLTLNFNAITQAANFLGLNGRTFPTPQDASDEVAQAIQEAMRLISREVGNTLSPDLMVKYKNEVFWNGHEILIGKEGDNQITLQPLGKFGVPLSPEQVSWTNTSNGVVDMTGLQNKSITLTRLDTAASLTVNIKRRSSFVLDIKTLLRPIVLQVLEEKLATVLDEIVNTRVDSVNNANSVSALVGQVEAGNVPLEGSEVLVPLFAQPLVLSDSSAFKSDNTKARTLRELRRAKAIRQVLRTKVNTRAFCNLLIQQPDKLDELLDELLLNSGTLLGELVLNLGDPAVLQTSRNIIITYLNENMTRLAGSNFGMANDEPITVTRVQSTTPAMVFDPATRLYIANNVDFPGKEAFRNELTTYLNALDTPLYVFVNYSQDLSTETYLKRTIGTRPAGLPPDAQFVTLTLVNIPGSVQYQMYGSKAGVAIDTSLPPEEIFINYVKAKKTASSLPVYFVDAAITILDIPKLAENQPGYYTYLTPSGHPITLSYIISPSFTGTTRNEWADNYIPEGVLLAFKSEETYFGASFTKSGENLIFNGYKQKNTENYFTGDNISTGLGPTYKAVIAKEGDCSIELGVIDYSERFEPVLPQSPKPVKSSLDVSSLNPQYLGFTLPVASCLPVLSITDKEILNSGKLIIGAYNNQGILYKLRDGNADYFIYLGFNSDGTPYYLQWDGVKWIPFVPAQPDCTSCDLRFLFSLTGFLSLLNETGHVSLDVAGLIPALGEPFDIVNGAWYTIEGDVTNATMSFSSTLPIVGWASTGGKWIVKYRRVGKLTKVGKELKVTEIKTSLEAIGRKLEELRFSEADVSKLTEDLSTVVSISTEGKADILLFDKFLENPDLVKAWKLLQNAPDGIRKGVKSLTTVSKFANEGIALTFKSIEDGVSILNKNDVEVGKLIKEGTEEILEISDDFILASTSSKPLDGIKVVSNASDASDGEKFINISFIKTADGSLAFVEDVSSYGSDLVKNAIKRRGDLRTVLTGIKATEDAHHIIPVQLLKENDVVKKAVEGGFSFNTAHNGLAIEKFSKATGAGRHGPHPEYTKQIAARLNSWALSKNYNYSAKDAKEFLDLITDDIKFVINDPANATVKINALKLTL